MSSPNPPRGDEPVAGYGQPLLYNLVYCSRAEPGLDEAAVAGIITAARRHNPRHGITGLLVAGSGVFFQWLEGPRDSVKGLMAKLAADPRHDGIVILSETEEVQERLFPNWDMELVTSDDIRDVLEDALSTTEDAQNAQALRLLIDQLDSGEVGGLGA